MATELREGVLTELLGRLSEQGVVRTRRLLADLAVVIETQAKINASNGAHAYGTKTPAVPGEGPAVISGTLRRSITHSPVIGGPLEFTVRVGVAPGAYPAYRTRSGRAAKIKHPVPSVKYGHYLEKGVRGGYRYPFLSTAARFGFEVGLRAITPRVFAPGWWR